MHPIVIIGSGLAGYTLAKELRKKDKTIPIHMVCADDGASYSKPMLSNALAKGKDAKSLIMADAETMAQQLEISIWNNTQVSAISVDEKTVTTSRGDLPYSKLVLALGADPIRVPLQGDAAEQVFSVNNLQDYHAFRQAIDGKHHVTIVGAGLIGCEFANDLQANGIQASIVDPSPQPLGRLLPEKAAASLYDALAELGVDWHLGTTVTRIDTSDNGYHLTLANGTQFNSNAVLSAIGLRPRIELARDAGIETNRGICVNRYLETSQPDIYALGDCAEVEGLVLPFVMPLMQAARSLAFTLSGDATLVTYPAMPVAVKTPCKPVVVAPPAAGAQGSWVEQLTEDGVLARFIDADESLLGFALTGDAVSEKNSLTKELPPTLV